MLLINLTANDIKSYKEQGADIEITDITDTSLSLNFQRNCDGYTSYYITIDNKYKAVYRREFKINYKCVCRYIESSPF